MGPSVFNAASERMDAVAQAAMAVIVNATAVAIPRILRIFASMCELQADFGQPQWAKQNEPSPLTAACRVKYVTRQRRFLMGSELRMIGLAQGWVNVPNLLAAVWRWRENL
jgi:hypothetical protein